MTNYGYDRDLGIGTLLPRRAYGMNKQILVVDDEAATRTLISILLQRRGFSIIEAGDGLSALQLLDTTSPNLIILDLMMPGMDGFELCRRLRARDQTAATPILIMSAMYDSKGIKASFDAGADDYLPKINLHPNLVTKVRKLLGETTDVC